ncbi:MAG: 4-hydroxy-3-methylbut-2-enyl diphosphate reductase [bacterium]
MKIIVAKTAGFCWGVKRAVTMVMDAKKATAKKVYTYGPLIHNSLVIEDLKNKGIDIYCDGDAVEKSSSLVVRAHGIPPQKENELENLGFQLINATCHHVIRAQEEVKRYSQQGYTVIIAGDRNHAETVGLLGFVTTNAYVVQNIEDIEKVKAKEPAVFLAQTTFNSLLFDRMKEVLRKKFTNIAVVNTICAATNQRQEELLEIAKEAQALVIIGDKSSANTKRLVAIAQSTKKPVYFIQTAEDLNSDDLKRYKIVGITAGASTPNWVSNAVVEKLQTE